MRFWLLVAAVILFIGAALSAFTDSVTVNEFGITAIGLACFAGSFLSGPSGPRP